MRKDPKSIYMTDDLEAIRAQSREYVEREIVPRAQAWEQGGVPREVLDEMGRLGFFGLRIPEEHGGIGLGTMASVVFAEELGRSTFGGFSITVLVHTDLATPYVLQFGTEDQKARWLPAMASGELLTAIGVTEPDAGSDVAAIRTIARRDGEDFVLNGTKMFITKGGIADLVFIAAKTDSTAKGSRGISIFAVERDTPGFKASRSMDKMGWHSSNTVELTLEDARVPALNLVGEENQGFYYIMANFQNERLAIMGQSLGEAQRALELTIEHVKGRSAFGSALWNKQTIRHRIAQRQTEIDAGRELTYHAAWLIDQGEDATRL
ncbi:MAG TPA: acyl-CoA dehydrogenase family protein, partial [Acidimicrobiia bacterium]|nr:acyl-CoA dehydrogenase family protein [Acidimicrobiia bacterium]